MKGLLTRSSARAIKDNEGSEFLQDIELTIKEFCESETCKEEVIHALIHNEYVGATLASKHDETVLFEIEAFIGDTIVLSYVG